MTCSIINTKHGPLFVCGSYKSLDDLDPYKDSKCYICGKPSKVLCDAQVGYTKPGYDTTCDRPMCRDHAHNIGKDTDVCQEHYNDYEIMQARINRLTLEKRGWPIQDNKFCPVCDNEEHAENAKFCKICGEKLKERGELNDHD